MTGGTPGRFGFARSGFRGPCNADPARFPASTGRYILPLLPLARRGNSG